jgi:hypothetical protein
MLEVAKVHHNRNGKILTTIIEDWGRA